MRAVNLLPVDRRGRARQENFVSAVTNKPLVTGATVVLAIAAASVAFLNHSASTSVSKKQDELQRLESALASVPKPEPKPAADASADGAARLAAVQTLAAPRMNWDGLLWSLSRVIPEDIWLDSLSMASPTAGAAPAPATGTASAPAGFVISGYTYSHPSVARLMRRLALVPWLTGVSLVSSERSELERRTVFKFSIGASIKTGGGQS